MKIALQVTVELNYEGRVAWMREYGDQPTEAALREDVEAYFAGALNDCYPVAELPGVSVDVRSRARTRGR